MALLFWLLLSLLRGDGCPFELQEVIEELQSENSVLQGKVQNLTEALSELRLFVWNRSHGPDATAEHLLREPCHPDAHRRSSAASHPLASSLRLLIAASFLAVISKVIS